MSKYEDTFLKGIKNFEQYRLLQYRQILDALELSANRLTQKILAAERAGKIPPSRELALLQQVKDEMNRVRPRIRGTIQRGTKSTIDQAFMTSIDAAEAAGIGDRYKVHIGTSFRAKSGRIIRYNAAKEVFADSMWARLNKDAFDAVMAWNPGGQSFSDRIWNFTYQARRQMMVQVKAAVIDGRSAARLASDLRKYLIDDKFRIGKALKDFRPGTGVYKSASKNALRLARTELTRAWGEGIQRYAKNKTWSDGVVWHISPINCCDICTERDGVFYTFEDLPEYPAHAHCMCFLVPHVKPEIASQFSV
jgi:hypothetical protein